MGDNEVYADLRKKREEGDTQSVQGFRPANARTAQGSYPVAEELMRCVVAILQEGISGKSQKDYIQSKAKDALRGYGLGVVTGNSDQDV